MVNYCSGPEETLNFNLAEDQKATPSQATAHITPSHLIPFKIVLHCRHKCSDLTHVILQRTKLGKLANISRKLTLDDGCYDDASWLLPLGGVNPRRRPQMFPPYAQIQHVRRRITPVMDTFLKTNVPIHWPTGVLYGLPSKNSILTTNNPLGNDRG